MNEKNRELVMFCVIVILCVVWGTVGFTKETVGTEGHSDSATYLSDGIYCIHAADSDDLLAAEGEKLIMRTVHAEQEIPQEALFYFTRQKNGCYSIVSMYNWKYLAVNDKKELTCEEDFRGFNTQLFRFFYKGKDYYTIQNDGCGNTCISDDHVIIREDDASAYRLQMIYE